MPLYDYVCSSGHTFELLCDSDDTGKKDCPKCGKKAKKDLGNVGGGGRVKIGDTCADRRIRDTMKRHPNPNGFQFHKK